MSPSKTMAARRQMRTPGERTSGAWTGGCAIHPDGGDETDRTAGNSYTATPPKKTGAKANIIKGSGLKQLIYGNIKAFKGPNGQIYQRRSTARLPIKKLSSNSIPKMIGNEEKVYGVVKPSIDRNLQHYVEQQIELLTK